MIAKGAGAKCGADLFPRRCVLIVESIHDVLRTANDENLPSSFKAILQPGPVIAKHAPPRACDYEDPSWRRKAEACHGGTVNIHYDARGTVQPVVIISGNVADPANIRGQGPIAPAFATKDELFVRSELRGLQE